MQISITDFQRNFRKAREAADRGDSVVVTSESAQYVFERRNVTIEHPFEGLEDVFGAVKLPGVSLSLSDKVRRRLAEKNRHRRRRSA